MIQLYSFILFFLVIIFNTIPGFFVYNVLIKKDKHKWMDTIIYSVLLSFSLNILLLQILNFLKIKVSPIIPILYIAIWTSLSIRKFSKIHFEEINNYEKYTFILFIIYLIVFGGFLLFGYTGNKYGDFVNHVNIIKATVEEKQLAQTHHYFFFDAPNRYPKGFHSIIVLPFLIFQENDAYTIAQVLTLFSRFIPLLFAFLIYIAAVFFTKTQKIGFYSILFFLLLDINILLPIYWGGLPTNFSRLLMFASFILIWKTIILKHDKLEKNILIASILTATSIAIRPDVIIYYPLMIISILVFYKDYKLDIIKILSIYGIITIILSLILYPNYIINYMSTLDEGSITTIKALVTGLFNWRRFIPLMPFIFFSLFSVKKKDLLPLSSLGFSFMIGVPFIMSLGLIYVSHHIFTTFTLPFSILCGTTIYSLEKKRGFRIMFLLILIISISLFIGVNIRQHYLVDVPLQENELVPIYWIKSNLDNNSKIFYLLDKGEYYKDDLSISSYYGVKGLQQLIAPFAEKKSLSMISAYSFKVREVERQFSLITQGIQNKSLSINEFKAFLEKNNFTHLFLNQQQYNQSKEYFNNLPVIFEDEKYLVLQIKKDGS